ncbi:sensor histidine kinase [Georgenia sp. Z1344]|uniref:sensor histidine kinase n=1 Tax=Georgenia sp. Z1344 TaxID=3416706 RepID=UPI003CF2D2CA
MPTLSNILTDSHPGSPGDVEWLHQLVGDWQVIADLAFADLLLWVPDGEDGFVVAAHCRPQTGATVHYDDAVRSRPDRQLAELVRHAMTDGGTHTREFVRDDGRQVRTVLQPVHHDGRYVAVLGREQVVSPAMMRSRIEVAYMEMGDALAAMVSRGEFPQPGTPSGDRHGTPRVGDGVIRLDLEGRVTFASPNALSNVHRLGLIGDLNGEVLAEVLTDLLEEAGAIEETLAVVVMGRAAWRTEVEAGRVILSLRAIPLTDNGERRGAVLLCRDVSEMRRREQQLLTKDATIREIHHRVKNNLQTVSALLRLQARRSGNEETREALGQAERRVTTIALVHDTLAQGLDEVVDFDDVFGRVFALAADVAVPDAHVTTRMDGRFGLVPADVATGLAVVLTELITNAVEHGLSGRPGTVVVRVEHHEESLEIYVTDDGVGLAEGKVLTGLGTQIVKTLVAGELGGTIEWRGGTDGGTEVHLKVRVGRPRSLGSGRTDRLGRPLR